MQDHRDGADHRSKNGSQMLLNSEYNRTDSFQDSYFTCGDEKQLDSQLSSSRDSHDNSSRSRIREATLPSSQDQLSDSYNLWTAFNSHGETPATRSLNSSSFGVNSGEYWTSSLRDESSNFPPTMRHNRGPLDVHTSPISSPVSSSEESTKPALQDDRRWKHVTQSGHLPSSSSFNDACFPGSDSPKAEEDGVHHQQMRASLELANRLAGSAGDIDRLCSTTSSASMSAKADPSTLWYAGERGRLCDAENAFDAHLRSAAVSSSITPPMISYGNVPSSQSKALQLDQRAFEQYVPPSIDSMAEFSIFVGDLSPDLREEDLVAQFLHPSAWPASHPFAIAHAHAQQAKGNYAGPAKVRPAPFTSTKSAKIMKDPLTGASRGFGFVRFSKEEDCARALVEMQGMVISPVNGPGRPLRVCTATPKNRTVAQSVPASPWGGPSLTDALSLYQQLQVGEERMASPASMLQHLQTNPAVSFNYGKPSVPAPFSPTTNNFYSMPLAGDSQQPNGSTTTYSNSALDPNNTTVFVGGLSSLISEDTLKTFFAPFGEIIYVKIPPGKGCGFVQFVKKMDAERAIERMQGFPIGGGRIRLSWGRSQGDKAAAAAAQAVAQTAQISQLASLASLSGMNSAQLNYLTAGMSTSTNETDASFFQRLAALAAVSKLGSREKENSDLHRASSLQHLPAMEHQHRQAQSQAADSLGYTFDAATYQTLSAPYLAQWEDKEQQNTRAAQGRFSSDDYLASRLPSLRLDEGERHHPSASHYSRPDVVSPSLPDVRSHTQPLSPADSIKAPPFRSSRIFSPFSPPTSPASFNEAREATPRCEHRSQHHYDGASDNAFLRFLETDRQKQQQQQQQQQQGASHHSATPSYSLSSVASLNEA